MLDNADGVMFNSAEQDDIQPIYEEVSDMTASFKNTKQERWMEITAALLKHREILYGRIYIMSYFFELNKNNHMNNYNPYSKNETSYNVPLIGP